jgi:hypothetical protein
MVRKKNRAIDTAKLCRLEWLIGKRGAFDEKNCTLSLADGAADVVGYEEWGERIPLKREQNLTRYNMISGLCLRKC